MFAGGAMDAIRTLAAILFHLTRAALHASVAPLRLIPAKNAIETATAVQASIVDWWFVDFFVVARVTRGLLLLLWLLSK